MPRGGGRRGGRGGGGGSHAGASPAHTSNGSSSSVSEAAAAFAAEVRRQRTDSIGRSMLERRDSGATPVDPCDEHGPGVLGFMRRTRSDSAATLAQQGMFSMDEPAAAAASATSSPSRGRRGSQQHQRSESVEAEIQAATERVSGQAEDDSSSDDENALTDHIKRISIKRVQSPTDDGAELECALLNQAAAASGAAAATSSVAIPARSRGSSAAATAAESFPSFSAAPSSSSPSLTVPASSSASTSAAAAGPSRPHLSVGDFELLRVIGRGAYGKVFLVRRNDGSHRVYAMKVVAKSEAIRKNVVANMKAERDVLEAVRHPFIVNLRYAFQTHSKLYLVQDFVGGGELFARLDASKDHALPLKEARFYAAEMVLALEHLHSLSIIYRDLKPENILLGRDGHLVLTDFGFAKEGISSAGEGTRSFCGTLHYMAPEMVEYAGHGKGSDWWALGCLLFEMLTGLTPFGGSNRKAIQQNILTAPLKLPKWMDGPTKSVLTEFLRRPVAKRLGCGPTGSAAIKKHAFFTGIDWVALAGKKLPPPFVPPATTDPTDTSAFDTRFTVERAVDTPVSPSAMALQLQGHGISPGAFHTADQTFRDFAFRRDLTPAQSPALRAMVGAEIIRRQSIAGAAGAGAGSSAAGPMGSPRMLSGLPPPHHAHAVDSFELQPSRATQASAAIVAASISPSNAAVKSGQTLKPPQPSSTSPVSSSTTIAAATSGPGGGAPLSPPRRVRKPKPVKASPSPPAPNVAAAEANGVSSHAAQPLASDVAAGPAASSAASDGVPAARPASSAGPSGGASSQLSKQLAARQQQQQQRQQPSSPSKAAANATAGGSQTARPAVARGWEAKSPPVASAATAASPAVAAAPVAAAVPAASAAPAATSHGIRVLGGIQQLAPLGAMSAAASEMPASSALPAKKLSAPLRLSASAAVFVPGVGLVPQARTPQQPVQAWAPVAAPQQQQPPASARALFAPAPAAAASSGAPVANGVGPPRWGLQAKRNN